MRIGKIALLILSALLSLTFSVAAKSPQSSPESVWSAEIAKQLVALGWENPTAPAEQPVVVYSLQFVQLSAELSRAYEFAIAGDSDAASPGAWSISLDENGLQLVDSYPRQISVYEDSPNQAISEGTVQEAWLVTVGDKPVRMQVREENVLDELRTVQDLIITLTPQQIDGLGQRISTQFAFDYTSHSGAQTSADTIIWTGPSEPQLVGIVSQDYNTGRHRERRHVAIYLQGTVVPTDKVPAQLTMVPIGNVSAFQALFPDGAQDAIDPVSWFAFELHNQNGGVNFGTEVFVRTEANHRLRVSMGGASARITQAISIDLNLVDDLFVVTRVETHPQNQFGGVIRFGIAEQTQWGPFQATAAVIPLVYEPGAGFVSYGSSVEGGLRYLGDGWDLFVEAEYAGGLSTTYGLTLYADAKERALRFTLTQTPEGSSHFGFQAIAFKW